MTYVNPERASEFRRRWMEIPGVVATRLSDSSDKPNIWVIQFDPKISEAAREKASLEVTEIADEYGGLPVAFE